MTREEAKKWIWSLHPDNPYGSPNSVVDKLCDDYDKRIADLEAEIERLKDKKWK